MDGLYHGTCPGCGGTHAENFAFDFSADALEEGLRRIYEGLDVKNEIERDIFEETLRIFNDATDKGMARAASVSERFLREVKDGNAVFSAFRTHRMQNDLARLLVDADGGLKTFARWKEDIRGITSHYVGAWLRTEYDTAVLRAQYAADWKQYEEEADVLPNLRWMPTTSITPDPEHRVYWEKGLTLPIGHPFWKRRHPQDRWNCKCTLRQTDEPVNDAALTDGGIPAPQPGLDNNPATDGRLFSTSHPYYAQAFPGAKKAVEKLITQEERYAELKRKIIRYAKEVLPQGDGFQIGKLTDDIKAFIGKKNIVPTTDDIYITDRQICHALRNTKQTAGKSVTPEQLANFPALMDSCEVYWDNLAQNIQYITRQDGLVQKFVVKFDYITKINGKKETVNMFITAGIVEERVMQMKNFVKIK